MGAGRGAGAGGRGPGGRAIILSMEVAEFRILILLKASPLGLWDHDHDAGFPEMRRSTPRRLVLAGLEARGDPIESLIPFIRRFGASNAKLPNTLRFEGLKALL